MIVVHAFPFLLFTSPLRIREGGKNGVRYVRSSTSALHRIGQQPYQGH